MKGTVLVVLVALLCGSESSEAQVHVDGHVRSNGSYVQPHYRSKPDKNLYNNYSYPGNVNPYTGRRATGNTDTYLRNNSGSDSYGRRGYGSASDD